MTTQSESAVRQGCMCCDADFELRNPDPWEGRLDGYCPECACMRCDTFPRACTSAYWKTIDDRERRW